MQGRQLAFKVVALLIGCGLSFLLGEIFLRLTLSTSARPLAIFRNPSLYADYRSDDDWWKLYLKVGGIHKPPETPHPLLGWVNNFDRQTYRHKDADKLGNRRPVLLFGDSFGDCVDDVPCFEDYLNADPDFSATHYLLNHSVGGYGLDQIYLLMTQVLDKYRDPVVIVTFMLEDVDRCVLSFRGGQKPVFQIVDGQLKLTNVPISARPYEWLEQNPISIKSYFYEFLKRGPRRAWGRLVGRRWMEEKKTEEKKAVGAAVLERMVGDLRGRRLDFTVIVFHPFTGRTWRDDFVREVFARAGVPYKGTEEIVREHMGEGDLFARSTRQKYMLPDLDHPNGLQNRLIADYIREYVLSRE